MKPLRLDEVRPQPGQIYAHKPRLLAAVARPIGGTSRSLLFKVSKATSSDTSFQELSDLLEHPGSEENVHVHTYEHWKFHRDFALVSMPLKDPKFLMLESAIFQLAQNEVMDVYNLIEELEL